MGKYRIGEVSLLQLQRTNSFTSSIIKHYNLDFLFFTLWNSTTMKLLLWLKEEGEYRSRITEVRGTELVP